MHTLPLVVLGTAAFLTAQQPAPDSPATAPAAITPVVRIETFGPAGWRQRLGPTNLGALCASEAGRAIWEPLLAPQLQALQVALGEGRDAADGLLRLTDYGGRIRIAVWSAAERRMRAPRTLSASLVLHRDGRTSAESLVGDLQRLLPVVLPGRWTTRRLGDAEVRVLEGPGVLALEPQVDGDRAALLIAAGDELEAALERHRGFLAADAGPAPRPDAPALTAHVDLPRTLADVLQGDRDEAVILRALGFDSLGELSLTIGSAGPRVAIALRQAFVKERRGLFAALLPAAEQTSPLLRIVPGGAAVWRVGRLDLAALYESVLDAVAANGRQTKAELRAEINADTNVDVDAGVLAHLTDEVFFAMGDETAGTGDEAWSAEDAGWMLGWRLRDTAAFAAGFDELLKAARPFLSREATEQEDGFTLHRYGNMLSYDVWFATGNGVVAMAGGREARQSLVDLQARAANAEVTMPAAMQQPFAALQRWLPANAYGRGASDLAWFALAPTEWWLMALDELVPDLTDRGDFDAEARDAALALLRKHDLARVRTATGHDGGTWQLQLFW